MTERQIIQTSKSWPSRPAGRRPNLLHDMEVGVQLFGRAILDSLPAHVAIINKEGLIIETNRAWRNFARQNGLDAFPDTIGQNYLEICDNSDGEHLKMARKASAGIRAVLDSQADEFSMEYPYHSPKKTTRWFQMRATRLAPPKPVLVLVSHEDITEVKEAMGGLRRRESELERQAKKLKESIIALRVLLDEREHAKHEVEENVMASISQEVLPYLDRVKSGNLNQDQTQWMELAESNLQAIVSPFANKLSSRSFNLTPMEIRVACLIKEGYSNKEISSSLNLSIRTIEFHRSNIRKKLGLSGRNNNLRVHLQSLS